mmetsp:Transcript_32621/g.66510  ORF Transcript_32621/g.66510 Transcript_32621/m.66510 type:complete len:124 (-) Transcript_32621:399-770(-)
MLLLNSLIPRKVAEAAIRSKGEFISQDVANLLWSNATMVITDKQLFLSIAPTAAKVIDSCTNQELSNIAWSYAVADVDAPTLFMIISSISVSEWKARLKLRKSSSSTSGICGRRKRSQIPGYQ